jgi:hypothetical protein
MQIYSVQTQFYFTDTTSCILWLMTVAISDLSQKYKEEIFTAALVFRDLKPYKHSVVWYIQHVKYAASGIIISKIVYLYNLWNFNNCRYVLNI